MGSLEQAHLICHGIEQAIRQELPEVERVLVHPEPVHKEKLRVAVPLDDLAGMVSEHFGKARYFAFVDLRADTGRRESRRIVENPHAELPSGRGLQVSRWLVGHDIDTVVTRDDIREKGPGYYLRDAGVTVVIAAGGRGQMLEEALALRTGPVGAERGK